MDSVAFSIFGRPVYWYGILAATGFLAAILHFGRLAPRLGLPKDIGSDLGMIMILGGIVGARIAFVLANLDYYRAHPAEIIRIDQGGLIFYGGFILATLVVIAFARIKRIPVLTLGDFTVSALPLGHAFGRVGCFLNGCCYGAPCDLPWAVHVADAWRHPVQLYEAGFNVVLYLALLRLLLRGARPGLVSAVYFTGYGCWRFVAEFFRGDSRLGAVAGLDGAQVTSLAIILAGLGLGLASRRRGKPATS